MKGPPSNYTQEIADEICRRLSEGESLLAICRDDHMPAESTVRKWADQDREGFRANYARAREHQAHRWAEEVIAIADEPSGDPQRARLRFDARRWWVSKALPKTYGDKLQHTGADGEGPMVVKIVRHGEGSDG